MVYKASFRTSRTVLENNHREGDGVGKGDRETWSGSHRASNLNILYLLLITCNVSLSPQIDVNQKKWVSLIRNPTLSTVYQSLQWDFIHRGDQFIHWSQGLDSVSKHFASWRTRWSHTVHSPPFLQHSSLLWYLQLSFWVIS